MIDVGESAGVVDVCEIVLRCDFRGRRTDEAALLQQTSHGRQDIIGWPGIKKAPAHAREPLSDASIKEAGGSASNRGTLGNGCFSFGKLARTEARTASRLLIARLPGSSGTTGGTFVAGAAPRAAGPRR